MTVEQIQQMIEQLTAVDNLLSTTLTTLTQARDSFEKLSTAEKQRLQVYCQKQGLRVLAGLAPNQDPKLPLPKM